MLTQIIIQPSNMRISSLDLCSLLPSPDNWSHFHPMKRKHNLQSKLSFTPNFSKKVSSAAADPGKSLRLQSLWFPSIRLDKPELNNSPFLLRRDFSFQQMPSDLKICLTKSDVATTKYYSCIGSLIFSCIIQNKNC